MSHWFSLFVNGLMRVRWEGEEKVAFICLCISTLWKLLKHSPFRPIAIRANAISTTSHASNYNHFFNFVLKRGSFSGSMLKKIINYTDGHSQLLLIMLKMMKSVSVSVISIFLNYNTKTAKNKFRKSGQGTPFWNIKPFPLFGILDPFGNSEYRTFVKIRNVESFFTFGITNPGSTKQNRQRVDVMVLSPFFL